MRVASPATVSRCGMVYTIYSDVGWKPYVNSWIERKFMKKVNEEGEIIQEEILNE